MIFSGEFSKGFKYVWEFNIREVLLCIIGKRKSFNK